MTKKIISIVLMLFLFLNGYSQNNTPFQIKNNDFDLKWLFPISSKKEVGKHKKLELGLELPNQIETEIKKFLNTNEGNINPFNPEDISIEFTFISPSKKQKTIYGFYYEDFIRSGETWKTQATKYHWRIRFAPDELGEWSFSFKVKLKDKYIQNNRGTSFKCVASKQKGVLQIGKKSKKNRYLSVSETGEDFFAIGHNIAHSAYYQLTPQKAEQHKIWLSQLAENGGNFFRLELGAQNGLPDWANYKNYHQKMPQMWEYDGLIEHAQNLGLYFIMFRHHTELTKGETWDVSRWDNNPYKIGFDLKSRREYFSNEQVIKWQKNTLRYIFSRWGYSTSFAFYEYQELDNWLRELQKETGFNDKKAITFFKDWYLKQKNYIQLELDYNTKLFINTYAVTPDFEFKSNNEGMFAISDVIGFHNYGQLKSMNYTERYNKAIALWKAWKKPFFVEEMGVNAGAGNNFLPIYRCSNVDFHNAIWSTSFMGGVGTGLNWWWDRGIHDFEHYKDYNALSLFFKDEQLNKEDYIPQKWHSKLSINRALIENYALKNKDATKIIGWVHNATYYWRNIKNPYFEELLTKGQFKTPYQLKDGIIIGGETKQKTDYTQKSDAYTKKGGVQDVSNQTFEIKGLKKSKLFGTKMKYKIRYYSTEDNKKIEEQILYSNIWGKIKPKYPSSKKMDYSYKIEYIEEEN